VKQPVEIPQRAVLTVGELTSHVKELLDGDFVLADVWVRGEISNFRRHGPSGHMYFTLKDAVAQIRAVMFRSDNQRLGFQPGDGMSVLARGRVSVYEREGQYQLYVREMQPDGLGSLWLAFEQLKKRLAAEGLFDQARKRPLPVLPRGVGVVTSSSGAALFDILKVAAQRYPGPPCEGYLPCPGIPVVISPAQVQGAGAAEDIVRAFRLLDARDDIDVIIVARGGGSLEELWAFNDEKLARTIRASRHPVVTGIGHEVDTTIADLAADRRAATPSNAAEIVFPSKSELHYTIGALDGRLQRAALGLVAGRRRSVEALARSAALAYPERLLDGRRQRVDDLGRLLEGAFRRKVRELKSRRDVLVGRLDALSPLAVLGRGYALCRRADDGRLVTTVTSVAAGDAVSVQLKDGRLDCTVEGVRGGSAGVVTAVKEE